jgi:membrane protein implicated in regulation of membrane protease activity
MASTLFLLVPVAAVLIWLYGYLLPRDSGWTRFDAILLIALALLSACWVAWVMAAPLDGAGPLWPHVLSAIGVYFILVVGMAAGLAWRRRSPSGAESRAPLPARQQT